MIRLYGPTVGFASLARVTSGMQLGLGKLGKLAGFVPIDVQEDDEVYPGADAPVGVYVGPPAGASMMLRTHARRFALLLANSSWMPEELIKRMWPHVTGFIACSTWGKHVLEGYVDRIGKEFKQTREVTLWPLGVSPEFRPSRDDQKSLAAAYEMGAFRVLHLASTHLQRKGTRELIEAWGALVLRGKLGKDPVLRLSVDGPDRIFRDVAEGACKGDTKALLTIRWASTRLGLTAEEASCLYRAHHLVAQPSRAEGFGLIPLESRVSGVPVLMTFCAGHIDHSPFGHGSIALVRTGDMAPIDDGPGALAPALRALDVSDALLFAHQNWPALAKTAQRDAARLAEQWSWEAGVEAWLSRL
jgi:glycosyltransferase involved in cell wall biosynthesis